jgi:hypothetical protein
MDHLADLTLIGRELKLSETAEWERALREAADFLTSRSPRYDQMWPRIWNADGTGMGWKGNEPEDPRWLSVAGVFCVSPLVKWSRLSGDQRYLVEAEHAFDSYWRHFGQDLATPPWGTTLDCGGFDEEAPTVLMRASLDLYEATGNKRYLETARDAADLMLTLMYVWDVGFPPGNMFHGVLNTVGWTFIGTQNEEIDSYGYFDAPDFYRLGKLLGDDRYKKLAHVVFDSKTQLLAREGQMFGLKIPGMQFEHINHTNCTYVPDGRWRGEGHSEGIAWVPGAALYALARLNRMAPQEFPLPSKGAGVKEATK